MLNHKLHKKRNKLYEELKYKLHKQENYEAKNEWVEMNIEKLMNFFKNLNYDDDQFYYLNLRKKL